MERRRLEHGYVSLIFLIIGCITLPTVVGLGILIFSGNKMGEPKELLIPKGATISGVSRLLYEEGVVTRPKLLKYAMRFTRGNKKLRAGEFRFTSEMSVADAMSVLYSADPIVHKITVPEGWNARQIAALLEENKLGKAERFLKIVFAPDSPAKFKLKSPSLEGYLYPDTYSFSRIDTEEVIVDRMVQRFWQEWNTEFAARAKNHPFTMEQLMTLASIVEKETGVSGERKLIASVFYNRLRKRMRLQSDPTTIYGIPNFNGNITKADLLRYSEYNTYTINGLPPGPIASCGHAAIDAVLDPASSEYLYFVSNNQGKHLFSKTYQDHLRYVSSYQAKRGNQK